MRLLSDTELREAMVRDYVRAYRAAGVREDEAKSMAESRAVTELLIVDAAKRDGLIGSNRAAKVETARFFVHQLLPENAWRAAQITSK